MPLSVSLPNPNLVVLGRADMRDNAIAFDWTCSGVLFRFRGNKATLHFEAPALGQRLYLQIMLDSRRSRTFVCEGKTDIEIVAQQDGEHKLCCVRINEVLDAVPIVMNSITVEGTDPALLEAPTLPDRRMLFIGDSITCGFGVLTEGAGNGFTTAEQDGAHTYAALTAAHFQAQAHFICISGRGIVRNCDNFAAPRIPDFFEQTTVSNPTAWDHAAYQPDVVVVNAGTNDTVGEEAPVAIDDFKGGVKAFIARLREVYPKAQIIWTYGMMATDMHEALAQAVADMNDENLRYVPQRSVWEFDNEQGACCHPNLRSHQRCAGVMIDAVAAATGWEK